MQIDLLFSNQTNNFKLLFSQLNFFPENMTQCLIDVGYKSFCLDKWILELPESHGDVWRMFMCKSLTSLRWPHTSEDLIIEMRALYKYWANKFIQLSHKDK